MAIPILGDVIREVGGVVRELIPDADRRMEVEVRLAELADRADQREDQLLASQVEVNKVEAASGNLFVAGWRPAIGWTCAITLLYTWVVAPVAKEVFHLPNIPALPTETIYPIVLAMLGIGTQRTVEKLAGVAGGTLGREPRPVPKQGSGLSKILPSWLK